MFWSIRLSSNVMQYNGIPGVPSYDMQVGLSLARSWQRAAEMALHGRTTRQGWLEPISLSMRSMYEEEEEDLLPNIKRWMIPMPSDRQQFC